MTTIDTTTAEMTSTNPATGEPVGTLPVTPPDAVDAVIARARAAQPAWAALPIADRVALLRPVGAAILAEAERLGTLLTHEMGKPLAEGIGETKYAAGDWNKELDEIAGALVPEVLEDDGRLTQLKYEPLGVCAAITPWNFPILMPHQSILPALVAGNTVILKPSEETPLIAQAYCEFLIDVLPENVLQVIHGDGAQGRALVSGDINLVVFTGSRATGEHILAQAGGSLKRVILELGGKDPLVVLGDADLDAAADFGVRNSFRNAGQVCVSTERIYVEDGVYDEFMSKFLERAGKLTQGNGSTEGITIGPMITPRQKQIVHDQVQEAIADGADLLMGGGEGEGNFFPVTVLGGMSHDMRIMRDETFGPVACIQRISSDEEAVQFANDSPYGLGAAVYGEVEHAARVASRIDAGMVGVNSGCGGAEGSPWVGAKKSGYGFHSGPLGHRQFTQIRLVSRPKN